MKRILAIIIAVSVLFSALLLTACSKKDNTTSDASENSAADNTANSSVNGDSADAETSASDEEAAVIGSEDALALTAEKTSAAAGEKVKVYFKATDCKFFAVASINLSIEGSAKLNKCSLTDFGEEVEIHSLNNKTDDRHAIYGVYVAETADISGEDICYFEIQIDDDAVSGSEITVTADVPEFQIGTDASGANTTEVIMPSVTATITVA